jgi:phosphinothricin acetyltransferase
MAPVSIDVRPAEPRDAEAVAEIYNHGIAERQATFETRPREANEILGWLDEGRPFIVAEDVQDRRILGFARVSAYSTRRAYAGVGEHAVYVAPDARGRGVGVQKHHGRLDNEWKDTVLVERLLGEAAH